MRFPFHLMVAQQSRFRHDGVFHPMILTFASRRLPRVRLETSGACHVTLGYARSVASSSSSGSRRRRSCARVRLPWRIRAGASMTVADTCSRSSAGLPTLRSQASARLISSVAPLLFPPYEVGFRICMLGGTAWSRPIGFSSSTCPRPRPTLLDGPRPTRLPGLTTAGGVVRFGRGPSRNGSIDEAVEPVG